jgi:hypothetical protein
VRLTVRPLRASSIAPLLIALLVVGCGGGHHLRRAVNGTSTRSVTVAPPSSNTCESARSAVALIDSIGVVVHFSYIDTAYKHQHALLAALRALGVRHIRDSVVIPSIPLIAGLRGAAREGITADLLTASMATAPSVSVGASVRVLRGSIDAFEGPNEVDASGIPEWPKALSEYMPALVAAAHRLAPGIPIIQPSFLHPADRPPGVPLPGLYNEHPYPLGGPPEPALQRAITDAPAGALERGLVFTETGYHNALHSSTGQPPVSEQAAAVYIPRVLAGDFEKGVRRTFIYELADEKPDPNLTDPEQHFGLLRLDLSPKPAFSALRTLISALLASPGPATRACIQARLAGASDVSRLDLRRPDGSRVLALWRPVPVWDTAHRRPIEPTTEHLAVTFDDTARNVVVWRPSQSPTPAAQIAATRRIQLDLGGDLVLVSYR